MAPNVIVGDSKKKIQAPAGLFSQIPRAQLGHAPWFGRV